MFESRILQERDEVEFTLSESISAIAEQHLCEWRMLIQIKYPNESYPRKALFPKEGISYTIGIHAPQYMGVFVK